MTVNSVNDAPTVSNVNSETNEDSAKAVSLLGSDIDGDSLSYSVVNNPSNGSVSISGSTATYTPNHNYNGTDSFTYYVNDGDSDSGSATVTMTVNSVNDAPTDIFLNGTSVDENKDVNTVVGTLSGSDPEENISSYEIVGGDTTKFNISGTNLRTSARFNYETTSSYAVTIRAKDTGNLTHDKEFTINVGNLVNETPTITSSGTPENVTQFQMLSNYYTVSVDNPYPYDNTLVFSLTSSPSGMSINSSSGVISWNVGNASTGTVSFTVKVLADLDYDTKTYTGINVAAGTFTPSSISELQTAINNMGGSCETATYGNVNDWDVTAITNMYQLFKDSTFNCNIGNWDVSNVVNMEDMFSSAEDFNQNIGSWDVSNVENMEDMFSRAKDFNQNIGSWDVSSVTNMKNMFSRAGDFNQNIGSWDVSSVTNMQAMFYKAYDFNNGGNASIINWDVSNVENFSAMFENAETFNQDLSDWELCDAETIEDMFSEAFSLDQPFVGWAQGNCALPNLDNMDNAFNYTNISKSRRNAMYDGGDGWRNLGDIKNIWPSEYEDNVFCWPWDECNEYDPPVIADGTPSNVQQYQTLSSYYQVVVDTTNSYPGISLVFSLDDQPAGMSINSSSGMISWNVGNASTGTVSFTVEVDYDSETITKTYTVNVAEGTFTFPNRTQLLNAIASLGGGCSHSTYGNINDWDVTAITDMNGLFANTSFNCNISSWDVSNVTNMAFMFSYNSSFNQPLNSWDVGNVTNMNWMFGYNSAFNQALNNWDVRNVVTFHAMFYEATSFNQPLNQWNLQGGVFDGSWGHRIDMESMFKYATSFNQNLSAWDVRSVKSMDSMFESATSFNNGGHDIRNWRPSGCQTMMEMFKNAHSFNQSVDEWAPYLDNVETAQDAFHYTNLIKERRDDILNAWLEDPDNFKIKNNWNSSYKENKNCWPWNECESFKLSNYGL